MANQISGQTVSDIATNVATASPTGAAGQGASQDSAKMAGTPAAKLSRRKLVAEEASPDRLASQKAMASQAAEKAKSLQQLGSLANRVSGLISQKMSAATAKVTGATALTDTKKQGYQSRYIDALSKNDTKAAQDVLLEASAALNVDTDSLAAEFAPKGLAETLTETYQGLTPDKLTLGDLAAAGASPDGTTALDLNSLANAFGMTVDAVSKLTTGEVDAKVQDLKSQAFSKVSGVRAQLEQEDITPDQRQRLEAELSDMYESGLVSAEDLFADIQSELDSKKTVMFRGKPVTVDQMLNDDEVTDIMKLALASDQGLVDLKKEAQKDPSLQPIVAFLTNNTVANLRTILQIPDEVKKNAAAALEDLKKIRENADFNTVAKEAGITVPTFATAAQIEEYKKYLENYNKIKDSIGGNWDTLKQFMTKEDVAAMLSSADPVAVLDSKVGEGRRLLQLPSWLQGRFSLDKMPDAATRNSTIKAWADAFDQIPVDLRDEINSLPDINYILQTPKAVVALSKNHQLLEDLTKVDAAKNEYELAQKDPNNADNWLNLLFEPNNLTAATLGSMYKTAKSNPTDPVNDKFIRKVRSALGDSIDDFGKIDLKRLQRKASAFLAEQGIIGSSKGPQFNLGAINQAMWSGGGLAKQVDLGVTSVNAPVQKTPEAPKAVEEKPQATADSKEVERIIKLVAKFLPGGSKAPGTQGAKVSDALKIVAKQTGKAVEDLGRDFLAGSLTPVEKQWLDEAIAYSSSEPTTKTKDVVAKKLDQGAAEFQHAMFGKKKK